MEGGMGMNRSIEQMLINDLAFGTVQAAINKLDDSELKEWLIKRLAEMEEEYAQNNRG
jgi:hypothetical protein